MKITKEFTGLSHVGFERNDKMFDTLIRFQVYYEHPCFRGKNGFSFEDVLNWFEKERGKDFRKTIGGMNLPNYIFEDFYLGKFNPLTNLEKELLERFEEKRGKKHYLVSDDGRYQDTKIHEKAHALFYLNQDYHKEILKNLSSIPTSINKPLRRRLSNSGIYHPAVFDDEMQAYLISRPGYFGFVEKEKLKVHSKKMKKTFDKFLKKFE